MAASVGICYLCSCDFPIFDLINLKLLRMPEMREYVSVFISNRNFHNPAFLSFPGCIGHVYYFHPLETCAARRT